MASAKACRVTEDILTYDFARVGRRNILLSAFREDDVIAGRAKAPGVRLRQIISRPPSFPFEQQKGL